MRLSILALVYDRSQKEIGAGAGIPEKRVSQYLRRGGLKEEVYERLLAAIPCPPAAVRLVTACLESLDALDREGDLTPEERAEVEEGALGAARLVREALTEAALLSRTAPPDYPEGADAGFARLRAEELWERLKELPEESQLAVVKVAREFQSWALCERACAESVTEASRNIERSAALARLAEEIAERVPGPEGWRDRVRGYARAHQANTLRVSGELKGAEAALEQAKRLWEAGTDPAALLDPGRLLDLEASLRRGQRRFGEALALLDQALAVGRSPARVLIKKSSTLRVMGDYEGAGEALLQAQALVERQGDRRLMNILRSSLSFFSMNPP